MSNLKFNAQQLAAINTRGKDILMAASAGSGKTTVMINRVVSLLKEGYDLSDMLIVSFTKAAAADMKEKLSNILIKDKELKSQLVKLTDADISTLHAWCKKLIDQYFYLINIDPDIKLIEDAGVYLKKAAEKVILEAKRDGGGAAAFLELEEIFSDNLGAEQLKKLIIKLVKEDGGDKILDDEECKKVLLGEINDKKSILKKEVNALYEDALMVNFVRNIIPIKELTVALELSVTSITTAKGAVGKDPVFVKINDEYKKLKDKVLELIEKELLIKTAKQQNIEYLNTINDLVKKTKLEFSKQKLKKNCLDFDDLEHYALKILSSEAIYEIRKKYKFIFVDEYQDINPLQNEIVQKLGCNDNNLFLIGDIKQSIYAFRGCEPSIFLGLYEEFKTKDSAVVIELNTNYRSKKEILQFSNDLFSKIMTQDFGGVDYKKSGAFDIDSGVQEGGKVRICAVSEDGQTRAAALKIAHLLAHEKGLKPGDIAVLVRSDLKSALPLQEELNKIGIKLSLEGKDVFVFHLIEYLKLIDNRFDDEVLINVLLGPFGGFSEYELAKTRMDAREEKHFYQAMDRATEKSTDKKMASFFAKLNKYRQLSKKINALDLINQIVADTNYFQRIFCSGIAFAKSFDAFLLGLDQKRHLSLYELLNEGIVQKEAVLDDDAIKLMTTHKSKGLEFEHVLILNAQKRFNLQDLNKSVLNFKGAVAIRAYDFEGGEVCDSAAHLFIRDRLKKRQIEEELRLLYVAVTRAKKGLDIFVKTNKEVGELKNKEPHNAISWWDWIKHEYENYAGQEFLDVLPLSGDETKQGVVLTSPDMELAKSIEKSIYLDHKIDACAPKMYVTEAAKLGGDDSDDGVGSDGTPVMFFHDRGFDKSSAELGTLYHAAMESICFEADFDSEWAALAIDIRDRVDKGKIKKAIDSMRELTKGKKYFKEQSFILKVGAEEFLGTEGNFVLMQGVMDLIVLGEDGDSAVIVDYKTGRGTNPEYKKQLEWYKRAAKDILNLNNIQVQLYLFD